MLKYRSSAIAAATILIVGHVLLLLLRSGTETASVWGDWFGVAAALLAAIVSWLTSRSAGPFGRRVWRLVAFSGVLLFVDMVFYTYYYDYLHASLDIVWPSDFLVFFWAVPAMMALFLSPHDPNSSVRWLRTCDFAQICALVLAIELTTVYVPSRWQATTQVMQNRALSAGLIFFGLLTVSFLVRGLLTSSRTVRKLFQRLALFFFVLAITENISLHAMASGNYQQGKWPDLLWTVTFCLLAIVAATWNDAEQPLERIGHPSSSAQLLAQFSPLLIPAIVFPLVLGIAQEQFWWSVVLASVSFAAAGGRMVVVHNQLLASSRELEKNLSLLQGIMEGTADSIFVKDLQGRYLMINSAESRLLGRKVEEVIGKDDTELFAPESGREIMAGDRKVVESGETQTYEEVGVSAGVARTYLSMKGPFRDANGQIIGLLGICRDVTQHKQLEQQLRQAQKMEAVGRLAGGVAHDFNNLLGVILGCTEMLSKDAPSYPALGKRAETIKSACLRAASLTAQLLAYSRRTVLQPKVLNLNSTVSETGKMLQHLLGEDIEQRMVLDPTLGAVKADPGQIVQVIMNLAVNARDAMPNGGQLSIETANANFGKDAFHQGVSVRPGWYVMLTVSDTGVGMDAETQAHIFEPFYTTKPAGEGTGLGLATVSGIIEQSGGYVFVESEPGKGTTFKIYLPRVDEAVEPTPPPRAFAETTQGSETVLLVEDDSVLRELIQAGLGAGGYKVLVAANGADALQVSAQHPGSIEALITDVIMPQMSGPELVRSLAPLRPGIKVLYISGYTDDKLRHTPISDPDVALIEKPFQLVDLTRKLQEILSRSAQNLRPLNTLKDRNELPADH
jgi:PAS domain S-box-containing protein